MPHILVISHTPHYLVKRKVVGWSSTVQELDYLARAFGPILHLAPLYSEAAPSNSIPYESDMVQLRPLPVVGGPGLSNKLDILRAFPQYARMIRQSLELVDIVQIRCPCHIGLVACPLVAWDRRVKRWAKYAGNWGASAGQPWSYRLQKLFLSRNLLRGPVTINGQWPDQPDHVHSFYNPSLTLNEVQQAAQLTKTKELTTPLRLLFVGRVETAKGVGTLLQIVAQLKQEGLKVHLDIIGDGPEKTQFEALMHQLTLEKQVLFHGWMTRSQLNAFYAQAHLFLLPSFSEGWPKVLSEGMAYGVVPLASNVSSIPQILTATGAGLTFAPVDVAGFAQAIVALSQNPRQWAEMAAKGRATAVDFTFETYTDHLSQIVPDLVPRVLL